MISRAVQFLHLSKALSLLQQLPFDKASHRLVGTEHTSYFVKCLRIFQKNNYVIKFAMGNMHYMWTSSYHYWQRFSSLICSEVDLTHHGLKVAITDTVPDSCMPQSQSII